jgi:hypothetical protein
MVADISTIFDRIGPTPLRTTWDHDDLVFIDLGHLRILIGCGDDHGLGLGSYLTVALTQTSSSAGKDEALASPRLHAIAKLLVQSLSERLLPDSETWIKVNGPLTVDTMENISSKALPIGGQRRAISFLANSGIAQTHLRR